MLIVVCFNRYGLNIFTHIIDRKPAGRYEVVQLRQAMEDMLDKSGVNDEDVEIKGPTQVFIKTSANS